MSKILNNEYEKKYGNSFRPFRYLLPAAAAAVILAGGCTDTGSDDGDGSGTGTPDITIGDNISFKAPVSVEGLPGYSGLSLSNSYYIFQPVLADFDGDGDLDIFAGTYMYDNTSSSYAQRVIYFLNDTPPDGDLKFIKTELTGLPTFELSASFNAVGPMFTAVGDIDGDGDTDDPGMDLMAGFGSVYNSSFRAYSISLLNNGDGGFNSARRPSPSSLDARVLIDLDGDDDLDLVTGSFMSAYSYTPPVEEGGLARETAPPKVRQSFLYYQMNDGSGSFDSSVAIEGPLTDVDFGTLPVPSLGDIDGDGDFDLFTVNYADGKISYYQNEGTATVPSFTLIGTSADSVFGFTAVDGSNRYFPAFGDLDGDNDLDIIAGDNTGKLWYIENTDIP